MYWLTSFLAWFVPLCVVGSTIWVGFDSRELRRQLGVKVGGTNDTSTWVLLCVVLWVVFFPMYLVKRSHVFAAAQERAHAQPPPVRYCEHCGTAHRTDAAFCPGCGTTTTSPAPSDPTQCAVCGSPIDAGTAVFCSQCGAPGPHATPQARNAWTTRTSGIAEQIRTQTHRSAFNPRWYERWYAIVGLIAAGLLIARGLASNGATGAHIDRSKLEAAIQTQTAHTTGSLVSVTCPAAQPLRTGYTFLCTATINRQPHTVDVTEPNGNGDVQWVVEP